MIWVAIRCAMERNGIKSLTQLARVAGINISTFTHTRRSNPRSFILYEILQLDKVLGFTAAEWEMIRDV